MERNETKFACPVGHVMERGHGKSFRCDVCDSKLECSSSNLRCRTGGCDYDVCTDCENSAKCRQNHLLQKKKCYSQFSCDVCCTVTEGGDRLCCNALGCNYNICSECFSTARCPKNHFFFRRDNGRTYCCDVCNKQGICDHRLSCKNGGCDYDVCSECISTARCDRGHFLMRRKKNTRYRCDVCQQFQSGGLRLCCKKDGCDFDICSECVEVARCPRKHFLKYTASGNCFDCDVCKRGGNFGPRVGCNSEGCNQDICIDCFQKCKSAQSDGSALFHTLKVKVGHDARLHWESFGRAGLDTDKTFLLRAGGDEYAAVKHRLHQTLPSVSLDSVWRVENGNQHELFSLHKSIIRNELGPKFDHSKMVRFLFHGAPKAAIDSIVQGDIIGFHPLLSGTKTGAVHGEGTYFARDAACSATYSVAEPSGQRLMLLAEVVVGLWVKGNKGVRLCPTVTAAGGRRFHSLVDNDSEPSIFVVQHGSQAYPAYLLAFH